jgi:hypothetical protein
VEKFEVVFRDMISLFSVFLLCWYKHDAKSDVVGNNNGLATRETSDDTFPPLFAASSHILQAAQILTMLKLAVPKGTTDKHV